MSNSPPDFLAKKNAHPRDKFITFDEGPHLEGDFGPYRQSERISIYTKFYHQLILEKKAYPCFYSQERLEALADGKLSSQDATIEDSVFKT